MEEDSILDVWTRAKNNKERRIREARRKAEEAREARLLFLKTLIAEADVACKDSVRVESNMIADASDLAYLRMYGNVTEILTDDGKYYEIKW